MSVSEERAEMSLRYMAETDNEVAEAKAELEAAEYILKRIEAREFLSESGSVKERESKARVSKAYEDGYKAVTAALAKYERIRAKRETERLVWETWRTGEASRRHGS